MFHPPFSRESNAFTYLKSTSYKHNHTAHTFYTHSQRNSIEDAANDARNMFQINQDMELIDEKFASQEMCAFGARTAEIKKQFTDVRKTQMAIFLKHMEIEMDFARPDQAEEEVSAADRGSTERGKKFQTKFEEKKRQ